jgi:hypothetical protein
MLIQSISIVAVHGLNGDARGTWTSKSTETSWLSDPDFLPKYLPRARILSWGYNANISTWKGRSTSQDRILHHAHTLVAQLNADREVSIIRQTRKIETDFWTELTMFVAGGRGREADNLPLPLAGWYHCQKGKKHFEDSC